MYKIQKHNFLRRFRAAGSANQKKASVSAKIDLFLHRRANFKKNSYVITELSDFVPLKNLGQYFSKTKKKKKQLISS